MSKPTDPNDIAQPSALDQLLAVMRRLRDPERGCAWDIKQSFATIAPYTIEEAYEVAEAIELHDMPALKDELGDLLFQVVFHAQMADEAGQFDFHDVAAAITAKMIRRHPHVFADAGQRDAESQTIAWEALKAEERAAKAVGGTLDGVSLALPALLRAFKLQKRASRVGFDWGAAEPVLDKIAEEIGELRQELAAGRPKPDAIEDELGDVLFAVANLARHLGVDPEAALRRTNAKFERRFRYIEEALDAKGIRPEHAGLERMDALWNAAKQKERKA